jgi:hypothetical protein
MRYLLLVLLLSGCSAFETQHLERMACYGFTTPWANTVERGYDGVSWSNNKYSSRRRYRDMPGTVPCFKEIMSKEQLAKVNHGL